MSQPVVRFSGIRHQHGSQSWRQTEEKSVEEKSQSQCWKRPFAEAGGLGGWPPSALSATTLSGHSPWGGGKYNESAAVIGAPMQDFRRLAYHTKGCKYGFTL